jgi:hypothetical protein
LEPWNFMTFHWECHHPTWRSPSSFGGVGIPPTRYGWKFMGKSSSSAGEHFPATFDENLMIRYRLGCLQSNYINQHWRSMFMWYCISTRSRNNYVIGIHASFIDFSVFFL